MRICSRLVEFIHFILVQIISTFELKPSNFHCCHWHFFSPNSQKIWLQTVFKNHLSLFDLANFTRNFLLLSNVYTCTQQWNEAIQWHFQYFFFIRIGWCKQFFLSFFNFQRHTHSRITEKNIHVTLIQDKVSYAKNQFRNIVRKEATETFLSRIIEWE